MTMAVPREGRIAQVERDGELVWKLQCPECWCWGDIDDDQLHGRVSVDHSPGRCLGRKGSPADGRPCTFHETRNWAATAARL